MKFFRCDVCGNLVEPICDSGMVMTCCRQEMRELKAGESDGALEKHIPVYTVRGNKVDVRIGSIDHPMTEEHYIQWVTIETKKGAQLRRLEPGQTPHIEFLIGDDDYLVSVYAYCNLHGLWKSE